MPFRHGVPKRQNFIVPLVRCQGRVVFFIGQKNLHPILDKERVEIDLYRLFTKLYCRSLTDKAFHSF